ncbi:MAG: hypothetical protein RR423_09165 [Hydrogenoanaerobacterium sp.]
MRRIKKYKNWGIYQNNEKEIEEYGFNITVLHPDNMEYKYMCSPADSDMELDTLKEAISWIDNY